jgi:hypothetical protein
VIARRARVAGGALALLLAAGGGRARADAGADERAVTLRVADELTVAVGEAAAVSLTVAPVGGRTVSSDGPLRVTATAGDGLALARRRYARRDAADPAAEAPRFDVRLRGRSEGDHALALEVRLWLCGAKLCRPVRLARTVRVHVVAPAPP